MRRFSHSRASIAFATIALSIAACAAAPVNEPGNMAANPTFADRSVDGAPTGYSFSGDVHAGRVNNPRARIPVWGMILDSAGSSHAGEVSQIVPVDPSVGRWYRFSVRGLPQSRFVVLESDLRLKVALLGDSERSYDAKAKPIKEVLG